VDFILDFLPKENYFFLLYLFLVFVFSTVLIFFIYKRFSKKKSNSIKKLSLNDLLKIVDNPNSTTKDLLFTLIYFNENFKVDNKSFEFFRKCLNHNNRNKALFDYFHNEIVSKYPEFKDKLDKIEREALNR